MFTWSNEILDGSFLARRAHVNFVVVRGLL